MTVLVTENEIPKLILSLLCLLLYMGPYSGHETRNVSAVLLGNGNFVPSEMSSGRQLGQSFDHPSHVLLPGMKLGVNRKTGQKWFLTSWRGEDIPELGNFTFGLHPSLTNRLVILLNGDIYWTSGYLNSSSPRLTNSIYIFDYISNENETYFNCSVDTGQTIWPQLTIDYLGVLSDNNGTLVNCTSASAYLNEGCVVQLPECRSPNDTFSSLTIEGLKFNEGENLTHKDCEAKCLKNCSCVAYASTNEENQTICELWSKGGLVLTDGSIPRTIYFLTGQQVTFKDSMLANKSTANIRWWIGLIVAVGGIIITLLCLFCYAKLKNHIAKGESSKKQQKCFLQELEDDAIPSTVRDKVKEENNDRHAGHEFQSFSFESISTATSDFSIENKLGQGGFGPVYKGKLSNGQEIAVKRLSRSSKQGLIEFKNEVILIAKLQHTNLVKLLGFCIQPKEKILIYEFMPNKSLDFFLFDSTKRFILNWQKRFNIIEGIAQGLVYLQKYSRLRVIHRDLKASNILLDGEMNPKISDFGMARIFKLKGLEENTNRIVGTYGYMPPEYAKNGVVSMKTDVFSYGVLLLEIVSGKKNNSRNCFDYQLNLIGYAWQLWNEGKALELIDPTILDGSCLPSDVLRCIHVGLLCVQDQASDRPTMVDVVSMLSKETLQLFPPKHPAFFVNTNQDGSSGGSEIKLEKCSINNVTHSQMEAR